MLEDGGAIRAIRYVRLFDTAGDYKPGCCTNALSLAMMIGLAQEMQAAAVLATLEADFAASGHTYPFPHQNRAPGTAPKFVQVAPMRCMIRAKSCCSGNELERRM